MRRRFVAGLALLVLAALAWRWWPAVTLAVALATPRAGPLVSWSSPAVSRDEIAIPSASRHLVADVYRPRRPHGALLLVHGLSTAGRRQPELARLAGLLAERRAIVLVPQFDGLASFRLGGHEIEDVRSALDHARRLAAGTATGTTGLAGFSFGAGPALLAAAGVPGLRVVASFGGYADLRDVIR